MTNYIIQDWASNVLCYDKLFKSQCFAVPMQFYSFDDAECYLSELIGGLPDEQWDEERGEYYIIEIEDRN